MGSITVRRDRVGKMSGVAFALGISAFLLGFVQPGFFPVAWISLGGGAVLAVALGARNRKLTHPTISHLAADPDEGKPIHPR